MARERRLALAAALAATVIWGLAPLLYKALAAVPPEEVLAHRTLWSMVFILGFCALSGRMRRVGAALSGRATIGPVATTSVLIAFNWGLFIWAIHAGHAVEASLGYFIFPVVSVAIGVVVLGERLPAAQWLAVALAAAAVAILGFGLGAPPWIALSLAASFACYGLLKKLRPIGPIVSVAAECAVLAPLALVWIAGAHLWGWSGPDGGAFGRDLELSLLLVLAGPVTGLPLILFSEAARVLRLSTVGLTFYLNPTLQFLVAVLVFGEMVTLWHGIAFALIWAGIALFTRSAWAQEKASSSAAIAPAASGTTVR